MYSEAESSPESLFAGLRGFIVRSFETETDPALLIGHNRTRRKQAIPSASHRPRLGVTGYGIRTPR
jgi:hypothetical protein